MPSSQHTPRFGVLALVTYGLVALTLGGAVAAYYYMSSRNEAARAKGLEETRTVQVGGVWIPAYPGASLYNAQSYPKDQTVEGSLEFESTDPAAQVLSFFENTMRRMGYQVTTTANDAGVGTVQAFRMGGRARAFVTVDASRDGSHGRVTTLYRDER